MSLPRRFFGEVMKLSIVIPVYNEKNTIVELLKRVKKADSCGLTKEIIVVDDCSSDGTKEVIQQLKGLKVLFHEHNQGKGAALRTGIQHATGDIILIQDADLEYNPQEYPILLEPILSGEASVVYGSRLINKFFFDRNMYYLHGFGNKFLTGLTNILFSSNLTDMETCYKVMIQVVVQSLHLVSNQFDIEPEITAKILKKGIKIHEVPIAFQPRSFQDGKKINWKDGIVAMWTLIKYRFKD